MKAKTALKERYIDFLSKEIDLYGIRLNTVKTVYIGGGTPLALSPALLSKLLDKLAEFVDYKGLIEFTIEGNPNDVTDERLRLLQDYGVTRINLGIQSFNRRKLRILNRNHDKKTVATAMHRLLSCGFNNVGFDIIYGIANDLPRKVLKDIKMALKTGITHLSAYSLIIEDKTVLKCHLDQGKYIPCQADREAAIYDKICRYLKKRGFIHYEISNFCKPNHQSYHNMIYWNNEQYFGLGAGAAGYYDNIRYVNVKNLDKYFAGIAAGKPVYQEKTVLNINDKMKEEIILGLRKTKGINLQTFKNKYNTDLFIAFPQTHEIIEKGLLTKKNNRLFIPEDKLFLSNEVLIYFI